MTASTLLDPVPHPVPAPDGSDPREELTQRLVAEHMPLARRLAFRYANRGIATDDLEQIAYVGLLSAARRFDPERGDPFVAYAVPTVKGELRKAFRDLGWMVRPPRRLQELQVRIWAAESDLEQELGRSPRPSEVAERLDVDVEDVIEALAVDGCYRPHSLDLPVGLDDSGATVGERLGGLDPTFALAETRIMLGPAVEHLSDRDRRILELRFVEGWTQQQIGDEIGVTQMQVSRLLTRILDDLRAVIEGRAA